MLFILGNLGFTAASSLQHNTSSRGKGKETGSWLHRRDAQIDMWDIDIDEGMLSNTNREILGEFPSGQPPTPPFFNFVLVVPEMFGPFCSEKTICWDFTPDFIVFLWDHLLRRIQKQARVRNQRIARTTNGRKYLEKVKSSRNWWTYFIANNNEDGADEWKSFPQILWPAPFLWSWWGPTLHNWTTKPGIITRIIFVSLLFPLLSVMTIFSSL